MLSLFYSRICNSYVSACTTHAHIRCYHYSDFGPRFGYEKTSMCRIDAQSSKRLSVNSDILYLGC